MQIFLIRVIRGICVLFSDEGNGRCGTVHNQHLPWPVSEPDDIANKEEAEVVKELRCQDEIADEEERGTDGQPGELALLDG